MIIYEHNITFTPDKFTPAGELRAAALQYEFQNIGAIHAELLGLGFEPMMADGQIWVITKLKTRITGTIRPDTTYRLVTYPKPKRGMLYQRDFRLLDGEDTIAIGMSQWCIVDFVTRKVLRTDKDFKGEFCTDVLFPEGFDRFRPGRLTPAGSYTITEIDLDGNNHTNNNRYAHMVELVLPGHTGRDFSITFARETRLGDVIALFTSPGEAGKMIVTGKLGEETVFTACL